MIIFALATFVLIGFVALSIDTGFLMAERRQVRRRNGARRWSLLRDLSDPGLWIERYHTATWLDYIRHNTRATHADAAITERIRALHSGRRQLANHVRHDRFSNDLLQLLGVTLRLLPFLTQSRPRLAMRPTKSP